MAQTFFDVEHEEGGCANSTPLRKNDAEKLARQQQESGWKVHIIATRDKLWEETYGEGKVPSKPEEY